MYPHYSILSVLPNPKRRPNGASPREFGAHERDALLREGGVRQEQKKAHHSTARNVVYQT